MTLAQVRAYALALPEVTEAPHFDRTSFRVRGKIFATARPTESGINVFVSGEQRELALTLYPQYVTKLMWGGKAVGVTVSLPKAPIAVVKDLLKGAWTAKAPKSVASGKAHAAR